MDNEVRKNNNDVKKWNNVDKIIDTDVKISGNVVGKCFHHKKYLSHAS
jgi:hypothetical protein